MAEVPVQNLVLYAVVATTPVVLGWAAIVVPRLVRRLRRRTPVVAPSGPSIEQVSADLRRVHRILAGFEPGTPAVRRRSAWQAYDALLAQACRAVDVDHRLH